MELATNFYTIGTELSFKTEIEEAIFAENGWAKLHHLLCLLAKKCQWPDIAGNTNLGPLQLPMVRWHALEELSGQKKSTRETSIGCFYLAVLLFFQSAWEYYENVCSLTKMDTSPASTNSNTYPGFLVIQSYPIDNQPKEFDKKSSGKISGVDYSTASKCVINSAAIGRNEFRGSNDHPQDIPLELNTG